MKAFAMKFYLLVIPEAVLMKSHQHDPKHAMNKDDPNRHAKADGMKSLKPQKRTKSNQGMLSVGDTVFCREQHTNSY